MMKFPRNLFNRGNKDKEKSISEQVDEQKSATQKEIANSLLQQDFLSKDAYDSIISSAEYTALTDAAMQSEIKLILDELHEKYNKHHVLLKAIGDAESEHVNLYKTYLDNKNTVEGGVFEIILKYEKAIWKDITDGYKAFKKGDYNSAEMIAKKALRKVKDFKTDGPEMIAESLSLSDDQAQVKKKLKDYGNIIASYADKFNFLYASAKELSSLANNALSQVKEENKKSLQKMLDDDLGTSPMLIENKQPHIDVSQERIQNIDGQWQEMLGTNNTKIGWIQGDVMHTIVESRMDKDHKKYSIVRRGEARDGTPRGQMEPTQYTIVDMTGKPVFDGYFLQYDDTQDNEGWWNGIKMKQKNDTTGFVPCFTIPENTTSS